MRAHSALSETLETKMLSCLNLKKQFARKRELSLKGPSPFHTWLDTYGPGSEGRGSVTNGQDSLAHGAEDEKPVTAVQEPFL